MQHLRHVGLAFAVLALASATSFAQQRPPGGFPGAGAAEERGRGRAPQGEDAVLATASEWGGAQGVYTCEQWRQYLQRMYNIADKRRRGYLRRAGLRDDAAHQSGVPRATFDYFDMSGKGPRDESRVPRLSEPLLRALRQARTCRVLQEELSRASAGVPAARARPTEDAGLGPAVPGGAAVARWRRWIGGGYGGGMGGGGFGR